MERLVVGVDVGTASARAGVVCDRGQVIARGEHPIAISRPLAEHAEHDSEDIWAAVCAAVRDAVCEAGADPAHIMGIAFDATCSLVARDKRGHQIAVGLSGEERWDTISWLDHRALAEAEECTATGHRLILHSGGPISPEMQTPKLMWLKRRLPQSWTRLGMLFDLADFLSWKASGSLARSRCTLGCKWPYLGHATPRWQHDLLHEVGLDDLMLRGGLPQEGTMVGADLGPLTREAARQLGLSTRCRVAAGLVDAHAATLAMMGGGIRDGRRHMSLIAGTSNSVMTMAPAMDPAPGLWGPYLDALLPGQWVSEGGQSATGALLDHLIRTFGLARTPDAAMHDAIAARVQELRASEGIAFAGRLHVLPDFMGNRSPDADPRALGVISGLSLDSSFDGLCRLYWRSCVAIALGVRLIVETMNRAGDEVTLHVGGGHARNSLLMELYADATGCTTVEHGSRDAALRGAGIAASVAAGLYPSLARAAAAMQKPGRERSPNPVTGETYERDFRIFKLMQGQRAAIDALI